MDKEDIQEASKILFEHRLNKTGLSSLKNLEPQTIDEAYAIQDNLKLRYLELKDNFCIGKKVGCTSLAAQKQMNIKEPFHGNLFYRYSSKNINLLNSKNFFEPYVEPEISFRIKDDINISKAPFKFQDLDYLLDGLFCSVEIVDFRFRKPLSEIGALNVISTNGASEFWIRDENLIKIGLYFKRELNKDQKNLLPIQFGIPKDKIVSNVNIKPKNLLAPLIPGRLNTYIYSYGLFVIGDIFTFIHIKYIYIANDIWINTRNNLY